jgi:hypothetical protein
VACGPKEWLPVILSIFLFFFSKEKIIINIFSLIYLYLFIKINTCRHLIGVEVASKESVKFFNGIWLKGVTCIFGIPYRHLNSF